MKSSQYVLLPAWLNLAYRGEKRDGKQTKQAIINHSSLCVCVYVCVCSFSLSVFSLPPFLSFPSIRTILSPSSSSTQWKKVCVRSVNVCVCATNIKKMRACELIQKEGQERGVIVPYVIILSLYVIRHPPCILALSVLRSF